METGVKVPLIDLKAQYLNLKEEIDEAVARVHERGNYVMGEEVEAFEEEWARYCKAKYCIGVSSGTDAIYLTLVALQKRYVGLLPAVWTTPRTFIGTVEPIFRAGLQLHLSDVGTPARPTFISAREAIIAVHLYGKPANFSTDSHYLTIEDSAQAHGLPLRGFAACFSFYPSKNLGAMGQAGAVVSNDGLFIELVKQLRNHGEARRRFEHRQLSGNYRIDELQAAVLRVKLPHLEKWNKRRREIAKLYTDLLTNTKYLDTWPVSYMVRPPDDHPEHVYHIYAVTIPYTPNVGVSRDNLHGFLKSYGVQTAVRYPIPLHLQPALQGKFTTYGPLGGAEEWANTNLSLPIYPELTDDQVEYVVECIKEWCDK